MENQDNPVPPSTTGWPRRSVLKAGAVAVGVGLLGRFAEVRAQGLSAGDYQAMDAWAMSQAIRSGELSADALLAAALARYNEVNPGVNAVNMLHEAYARDVLARRRAALHPGRHQRPLQSRPADPEGQRGGVQH